MNKVKVGYAMAAVALSATIGVGLTGANAKDGGKVSSSSSSSKGGNGGGKVGGGVKTVKIELEDHCDPATFPAAPDAAACTVAHEPLEIVTRTAFLDAANALVAGAKIPEVLREWEFSPSKVTVAQGSTIKFENEGGQAHTLSVDSGARTTCDTGIVNTLFAQAPCDATLAPGATMTFTAGAVDGAGVLGVGTHTFYSQLAPWMSTTITVV